MMKNAVVKTGGKQYVVAEGDTLEIERLDAEPGSSVTFDEVLMIRTDDEVRVGTPVVEGARVVAQVLEHKRGPKIIVWKMKRRKGYRRKRGHRQELTVVRIEKIEA